jgi:hypothetical protein
MMSVTHGTAACCLVYMLALYAVSRPQIHVLYWSFCGPLVRASLLMLGLLTAAAAPAATLPTAQTYTCCGSGSK